MATKNTKKKKHIPQRTCVGCRLVLPKRNLIRLVRTEEGVSMDPSGKLPGRGAYLHDQKSCWAKGLRGPLANALRTTIREQDMAALKSYMECLPAEEVEVGSTPNEEQKMA